MQTHSARARLPLRPRSVPPQSRKLLPCLPAIRRTKQRRILHARVHRIRIAQRRLQVPHPLELPRVLRPVIKLVCSQRRARRLRRVVHKFIALALRLSARPGRLTRWCSRLMPRLAAVIRALNNLPEPSAGLRSIYPVRVHRRSLQVIHFPAGKMRPAYVPFLPLAIRRQDKRALLCPHQHTYSAHCPFLPRKSCPGCRRTRPQLALRIRADFVSISDTKIDAFPATLFRASFAHLACKKQANLFFL